MIGHLLDLLILVLLFVALGFGLVIDRRVRRLMKVLAELEPTIDQFSSAVDRSAESVTSLRSATAGQGDHETRGARGPEAPVPALRAGGADGTARIDGKSDLVRSFFENVKNRGA